MRKLSPIILALALSPLVQAEPVSEVSPVGKIDGMVSLPVTGMKAVESNGRIVFMSDSGRFVIDGTLYDAWSKKPLTSLEEIREGGNTLDLSRLGLKMDDLNPLTVGEGKKKVVVFVDPRYTSQCCSKCGCIDKRNRKSQETFLCVSCGFAANADANAAANISIRGRGHVSGPYFPDATCTTLLASGA